MTEEAKNNGKKGNSASFLIFMGVLLFLASGGNFLEAFKTGNIIMMFVYGPLSIVGIVVVFRGIMKWRKGQRRS